MYVTFKYDGDNSKTKITECFYNDPKKQRELMHRLDVDKQVKEWQKTYTGQPPIFGSRIRIIEFISDAEAMRRNISFPKTI